MATGNANRQSVRFKITGIINAFTQFLAGAEIDGHALADLHFLTGFRVAGFASLTLTDGESAEATQLHAAAINQGSGDFTKNSIYQQFNIALVEVGKTFSEFLHKLGLFHGMRFYT